jgi:hypothetical protein
MKAAKGIDDLAARLTSAAATPLVAAPAPAPVASVSAPAPAPGPERAPAKRKEPKAAPKKEAVDTMQLTLRPTRALYGRYVAAAADRSRTEGRVVSAQEIMLEILEKGAV